MAWRQKTAPNIGHAAIRGWCLKYNDDTVNAPTRRPNARAALNAEIAAKRLRGGTPPQGLWVPGYLDLRAGAYAADDHTFLMKYLGNGRYEIHDSEVNSGARKPYGSINELLGWFGRYSPVYVGWSTQCDGATYVEEYTPAKPEPAKPATFVRRAAKGTFHVTIPAVKIRSSPNTNGNTDTKLLYKKGMSFNYDSYVVTNGYVWLSYLTSKGQRRYVAEGPYDGNPKNVYGTGGV